MGRSLPERFWSKVNKDGPLIIETPCWVWTASTLQDGYGCIGIQNTVYRATKISLFLENGFLFGKETTVCHKCDNPPCVRPDHLFIGTGKDNMQDASKKGRLKNRRHKINLRGFDLAVFGYWLSGYTADQIAEKLKISGRTIRRILCDSKKPKLTRLEKYNQKNNNVPGQ